jgi:integrase
MKKPETLSETPKISARAARLLVKSRAYRSAADADATRTAYASDYAAFKAWCHAHGFMPMPPDADTVGAYLASCGEGYALSTLRRRVAAIAHQCRLEGHTLDTRSNAIRGTMKGIARNHGEPGRRAAALATEEILRLCEVCDDSLPGLRDRALFLVGFAGAFRRSELVGLDADHIKWTGKSMVILIERSKTDKEGSGAEIAISAGDNDETCPVTALKRWLKAAEIKSGPVFRKVNKAGHVQRERFSTDAVRQILLKRAAMAGLKGTRREPISPHGLRAGFVTTAYRNGVLDEEIMGHTRHRSLETMRSYVRRSKLNGKSPSSKVGL